VEDVGAKVGALLLDEAVAGAFQLLGTFRDLWLGQATQELTTLQVPTQL